MIWLSTLCLLLIIAWLIMNGINEKNWVDNHLHDERVASDPGILPALGASVLGEQRMERASGVIKETGEKLVVKTADVAEKAGDAAGEVINKGVEKSREVRSRIGGEQGAMGRSLEKARETAQNVGNKGRSLIDDNESMAGARDKLKARGTEVRERIRERVNTPRPAPGTPGADNVFTRMSDRLGKVLDKRPK